MYSNRLRVVKEEGNYSLYEYIPKFSKPMAISFEKMRVVRCLRFWYEMLKGGYKVYYLADNDTIVGYCVVTPGGRRLSVSKKDDIVVGPYFISPQFRERGYAKALVRMTLNSCTYNYKFAFDWIHKDNYASIKTSEACGFVQEGHRLNVVGIMRKLVLDDNGNNIIYKYTRK